MHDVFTTEFAPLWPQLVTIAGNWCKSRDDAEDLAADTLERVLVNVDKYTPNTDPMGWSCRIMRNLVTDRSRARQQPTTGAAELDISNGPVEPDHADGVVEALSSGTLASAIDELSPEFQDTLQLSLDGFSAAEIAEIQGVKVQTVYSRMKRIRTSIKSKVSLAQALAELAL